MAYNQSKISLDKLEIEINLRRAIERLNNHTSVRLQFIDLRKLQLKTRDPVSNLSETSLRSLTDQTILTTIFSKHWPKSFQLNCLRWIVRGLDEKLAIAKIELDIVAKTYRLL